MALATEHDEIASMFAMAYLNSKCELQCAGVIRCSINQKSFIIRIESCDLPKSALPPRLR
jgi:hypothetical protein